MSATSSTEPFLDAAAPLPQLLTSVRALREAAGPRAAAQRRRLIGIGAAIISGLVVATVLLSLVDEGFICPGVFAVLVGSILAVVNLQPRVRRTAELVRCANERCAFAEELLQLLALDVGADDAASLRLDLDMPDAPAKRFREGDAGRWKVVYYVDRWLSLRGRLLDGSRFDLVMTEKLQSRSRTKTNARGKRKTKRKSKSSQTAALWLKVKPDRYRGLPVPAEQARAAVTLTAGTALAAVETAPDSLQIVVAEVDAAPAGASYTPQAGHHLAASLFTSLYAILRRARAGAEIPA